MRNFVKGIILKYYQKKGLTIGENSEIIGWPKLGSEPYLITIGHNVTVSNNVQFINHDGATRILSPHKMKLMKFGAIVIESNSFIGAGAILMPGVKIGKNCIVGAGSVVTKNLPDNSVAAGNPARVISNFDKYQDKIIEFSEIYDYEEMKKNKREYLRSLHL